MTTTPIAARGQYFKERGIADKYALAAGVRPVDAKMAQLMGFPTHPSQLWQTSLRKGEVRNNAPSSSPLFTPQYISRKQAAAILSCSEQLVVKFNKQGVLPMYGLGRLVRISVADVHEMLRRMK